MSFYSLDTDRLKMVAAAFSRASSVPCFSAYRIARTAPEKIMLLLLPSHRDRFRRAVTACSWVAPSRVQQRSTRKGMAPASAISKRLLRLFLASRRTSLDAFKNWTMRGARIKEKGDQKIMESL